MKVTSIAPTNFKKQSILENDIIYLSYDNRFIILIYDNISLHEIDMEFASRIIIHANNKQTRLNMEYNYNMYRLYNCKRL